MRDAGHRTPDAGHRTAKKAKIICPPPRGVDIMKCSKCNTFQVIIDLVHDFMNFIALKINKKKIKTDPGLIFTQGTLLVAYYIYARYEKNPRNSE